MAKRKGRSARRKAADQKGELELVQPETTHAVKVMADHALQFPDLYLSVFVVGDDWEQRAFAPMFSRALCHRAKFLEDADLVVFTGGPDVDPQLYGERAHKTTRFNPGRDDDDIAAYMKCLDLGIPMMGVCRGMQFLHVMNGGKLYQDIENHQGTHKLFDVHTKELIEKVSSVHHQSVIPQTGMTLVATAIGAKCMRRAINPTVELSGLQLDVEALFYPETLCFGVQGHPEYSGYNAYTKWCLEKINEFVIINPDVEWVDKRRRLRPDLLAQRNAKVLETIQSSKKKETN